MEKTYQNSDQDHPCNQDMPTSPLKIDGSNLDDDDSFFSNEENSKDENQDPNIVTEHPSKRNEEEILHLADQADELKVSRQTLMFKYNSSFKEMPHIPEEPHEEPSLGQSAETVTTPKDSTGNTSPDSKTTENTSNDLDGTIAHEDVDPKHFVQKCVRDVPVASPIVQTLENQPHELPAIEGYLKKQRPGLLHIWQKRYIILANKKLLYYKDKNLEKFLGCIDFDLISVKIQESLKDPRVFEIIPHGGTRNFIFRAENENEAKMWTDALVIHAEMSGASKLLTQKSLVSQKNYWKNDRLSEAAFLAEVKTGDLLLFKSGTFAAKLQRSVTRSEYDHVALILKLSDRNMVLFEATGNSGVALCRWTTFKRNEWHKLYTKVVYRKLEVERSDEFITKIEKFVKTTVGNKYAVNAKKLMQRKSTSIGTESLSERTYFCSELVAACYKRADLLPTDISSSRYLPCSFSAARKLPLLKGAKLGREMLIDFSL